MGRGKVVGKHGSDIPGEFAHRIERAFGDDGRAWLERLPAIVADCKRRWSLSVGPPFASANYSYTAPAQDPQGAWLVLKLAVPGPFVAAEIDALRLFDGDGTARLIDSDEGLGAMLLERLEPGGLLLEVEEREAMSVAAGLMARLKKPVPPVHRFHDVWEWMRGLERLRSAFDGGTGPFPADLVERAEALLASPSGERMILHGDLHHYNILSARRAPWLAIDPKGIVGEPEYEAAAFLRNSLLDQPEPRNVLSMRIDRLAAEAGLDRERMIGWGLADRVLSAWWSYEESRRADEADLAIAALYAELQS